MNGIKNVIPIEKKELAMKNVIVRSTETGIFQDDRKNKNLCKKLTVQILLTLKDHKFFVFLNTFDGVSNTIDTSSIVISAKRSSLQI
jgi:hypothetical protein